MDKPVILVAGGAGYIGSHCCKAIAAAGYLPVCIDNLSTGHRNFVKWGPLVECDIADVSALARVFATYKISSVVHLAAFSAVGESVANPQKYYLNNVAGTLSLLESMRQHGCNTIVFSSTGAVYGNASSEPIAESAAGPTVNPYGTSKWIIEQIMRDYAHAYGLRAICQRYFNASGATPTREIGEDRNPETHLIPRAMMALQGYVSEFAVFGEDYDTPDGTAVRDYIHVDDLAAAHVLALQMLLDGHRGGSFNLGTGRGYSVKEILTAIRIETGRSVPFVVKPRRLGDPAILVADPTAALRELGFAPKQSDLKTIIRTAWAWHQVAHPAKAS